MKDTWKRCKVPSKGNGKLQRAIEIHRINLRARSTSTRGEESVNNFDRLRRYNEIVLARMNIHVSCMLMSFTAPRYDEDRASDICSNSWPSLNLSRALTKEC